ncbi:cation:dicarboxylate symporter family transporter [Borreliella tanukii]|uniref:cation:dicarboxylate symporter family transporter n=1 Tax=Borreliella tanukii TaxID=56146 RepID=UPI0026482C0C|nr:cation:dicarboxylase symporter family transporter [Borreliella tanukii]WKC80091.1 cation:dicarboxylase symporter family transporter [Borreliella tanukii]WKC81927.1 cation:dicarboxylase symporter family transporter [Borreliella tanukii]
MDKISILYTLINIIIMLILISIVYLCKRKNVSFTKRVFISLGLGIAFGTTIQYFHGTNSSITNESINWINILGEGYVRLLKMVIIPLIITSIISAIIKLTNSQDVGKMSLLVILTLVFTAGIAAIIGIFTALMLGLTAEGLQAEASEILQGEKLQKGLEILNQTPITQKIAELIPQNIFEDLAGLRKNSTIGVVIFSAIVGIAALKISIKKPESIEFFKKIILTLQDIILGIVTLILKLTPYAILALMTKITAISEAKSIIKLGEFVIASYIAIGITLLMHMTLIAINKLNPITFLKKISPALTFAFISRSSAATIPINIEIQTKNLGVSEGIANLSSSFGTSIGQNGCAALHPAMLAVMIAPTQGINPTDTSFILTLLGLIIITSFGAAGAGGGATTASLMVLSAMNFPVGLVGLVISVEPLIDMGRTAVNVGGSMLAGVISAKQLKQFDHNIYNKKELISK